MMEIVHDDTDVREPEPVGFLGERECISEMMRRPTFLRPDIGEEPDAAKAGFPDHAGNFPDRPI
jgi:hypothetical protein